MHDVKAARKRCSLKRDAIQIVERVQQVVNDRLHGHQLCFTVCYNLDDQSTVNNGCVHFSFGPTIKLVSHIILHGFERHCLQVAEASACCSTIPVRGSNKQSERDMF